MIRILLYEGPARVGSVHFRSLLSPALAEVEPPGLLRFGEIEQIRKDLCQLPQVNCGKVGKYRWREDLLAQAE